MTFAPNRGIVGNTVRPLVHRHYSQSALFKSARIIGHSDVVDFWKKADKLNLPAIGLQDAVCELAKPEKRPSGRLELRDDVRKLCWQLLGPPPDHPEFGKMGRRNEPEEPELEPADDPDKPTKKARKPRTRSR